MQSKLVMYICSLLLNGVIPSIPFLIKRTNYIAGIISFCCGIVHCIAMAIISRYNTQLQQLRTEFKQNTTDPDKLLVTMLMVLKLVYCITAGLSATISFRFIIIGTIVRLLGIAIRFWALKVNTFLATTVCIQKGHKVIDSGPYSIVRHPFYSGVTFEYLSISFLFGSAISLILFLAFEATLVMRIHYEEKTLKKELDGYEEYSRKVRYKLIPLIF